LHPLFHVKHRVAKLVFHVKLICQNGGQSQTATPGE
jgi:hypothetical protein